MILLKDKDILYGIQNGNNVKILLYFVTTYGLSRLGGRKFEKKNVVSHRPLRISDITNRVYGC